MTIEIIHEDCSENPYKSASFRKIGHLVYFCLCNDQPQIAINFCPLCGELLFLKEDRYEYEKWLKESVKSYREKTLILKKE